MKDFNFTTNLTLRKDLSSPCLRAYGLRAVVMVLLVVLGAGNAWAGSASTQARAYLKDGSPTGSGKVYIEANDATAPADNKYTIELCIHLISLHKSFPL